MAKWLLSLRAATEVLAGWPSHRAKSQSLNRCIASQPLVAPASNPVHPKCLHLAGVVRPTSIVDPLMS
jgi:hypothetical protein